GAGVRHCAGRYRLTGRRSPDARRQPGAPAVTSQPGGPSKEISPADHRKRSARRTIEGDLSVRLLADEGPAWCVLVCPDDLIDGLPPAPPAGRHSGGRPTAPVARPGRPPRRRTAAGHRAARPDAVPARRWLAGGRLPDLRAGRSGGVRDPPVPDGAVHGARRLLRFDGAPPPRHPALPG